MRWQQDLIKDIRYFDSRDDEDQNSILFSGDIPIYPPIMHFNGVKTSAFSPLNQMLLKQEFLKVKNCKCILEIGVSANPNYELTSTNTLLSNKSDDCVYIGIDIMPKPHILSKAKNVHFIQDRSENFEVVKNKLKEVGRSHIDVLMIDGWHSINQVLLEWEYTEFLSEEGLVIFHDTRSHPGPHLFVKYLDKNKWDVVENACNTDNDYGIGFVKRKIYK